MSTKARSPTDVALAQLRSGIIDSLADTRIMLVDTKSLHAELLAVNREATALCAGLTANQLAWQPQPEIWSIAQNLAHLIATTKIFLPAIDQSINQSWHRGLKGQGPFRLGPYGRFLVWYVEPPPIFRLPAPRLLRPQSSDLSGQVLETFLAWQDQVAQRIEAANGLNLTRLRFPSPLARYIRMNLLEFFSVFNGHSRRHLWQADKVRRCVAD